MMLRWAVPEDCGVDSLVLAAAVDQALSAGKALHSLLVIRHNAVVLEAHAPGHSPTERHILNSCTKTVLSTLIGIAIEKGLVREDDIVVDYFPEYARPDRDRAASKITMRHLLTMSSGISWPQYGPNNVSDEMGRSDDWIRFILGRPMAAEPGTVANYSNGDSHLVSAVLEKVTGGSAVDFAHEALFGRLGIRDASWGRDPQGRNVGSATLYLRPRDLAKIGCLYLARGEWEGERVVPAWWIQKCWSPTSELLTSGGPAAYGYYWWLYPERGLCEAWGGACQRLAVLPQSDFVIVITADIPDDKPRGELASAFYESVLRSCSVADDLHPNVHAAETLESVIQRHGWHAPTGA